MRFIASQGDSPSINVAGIEYSPDASGAVTITDPVHVAAAEANGFTIAPDVPLLTDTHEE
jgi:hypothetical protein